MASIALKHISKSFGETRVLKNVDLDIHAGEFLTLVGPSGCGKSTLLRILAGLEAPNDGSIEIDGKRMNTVRASERNLAMVFQSYALYPHLTVAENMMTPLKLRDLSLLERAPVVGPIMAREKYRTLMGQVEATAKVLKIEELLQRKPGQLSGGQRQRAALGRAMVRKPVAFLMDEPLSNLDAELRVHMRAELVQLHQSLGVTFIYVTHDQAEALTMSDRMAVMRNGHIMQLDTPHLIYTQPDTLEVAKFIGSPQINVFEGQAAAGSVRLAGKSLSLRVDPSVSGPVHIGVRAEHLLVEPAGRSTSLNGKVTYQENLGSDVFCHVVLMDGKAKVIARMAAGGGKTLMLGDEVKVRFANEHALIFGQDGQRLEIQGRAKPEALPRKVA